MNVDLAIVGAGPAGSTLAALLAQRGARVALLDRDAFPRDKLCGGAAAASAAGFSRRPGGRGGRRSTGRLRS